MAGIAALHIPLLIVGDSMSNVRVMGHGVIAEFPGTANVGDNLTISRVGDDPRCEYSYHFFYQTLQIFT